MAALGKTNKNEKEKKIKIGEGDGRSLLNVERLIDSLRGNRSAAATSAVRKHRVVQPLMPVRLLEFPPAIRSVGIFPWILILELLDWNVVWIVWILCSVLDF